jgi:hypothetical protein
MAGKKKPGPKTIELTPGQVNQIKQLAGIQCAEFEIAHVLGISPDSWTRIKVRQPEVEAALNEGRELGKVSLRRKQWELANKGNTTMLVWLGKQWLGQADKQEIGGPGGGDVVLRVVYGDEPKRKV